MDKDLKPLISIVIPCYNYGRYLAEAIDSALAQAYRPIEIIVIDDGSTDDTAEVAGRYEDRGVKYIRQNNAGPAAARNRGARVAAGEYIIFLDADDTLEPTYAEVCEAAMATAPEGIGCVYTQMRLFGAADAVTHLPEYSVAELRKGNFINASALLKRELVLKYPFDRKISAKEDWSFYLTLAEHDIGGLLVNKALLNYRQHGTDSRDAQINRDPAKVNRTTLEIMKAHPKLYSSRDIFVVRIKNLVKKVLRLLGAQPII